MRLTRTLQPMLLTALLAAGMGAANAQTFSLNWNPRSGDVWVDTWLGDMNRYGSRYRDPFIDEMVRYHGAPRDLVTDLLVRQRWAPGDVYYACTIAQIIGRPCRYVADYWQQNHAQGWGVVSKRLGIKPGSAEFHRLKNGFVPTYDRWSRPITLDADLKKVYPNHGKSKSAAASHGDHGKPSGKGPKNDKGSPGGKGGKSGKDNGHGNGKGKH